MNFLKTLIIFLLLLSYKQDSFAQSKPTENEATTNDVQIIADPRLQILMAHNNNIVKNHPAVAKYGSGVIRSARGYRVLIYSGIDRAKANSAKADFMRRYSNIRVYMTYALPQYRIKVGDFSSRDEANQLYRQLTSHYSPCMVVPDIVEINTFKKND